MSGTLGSQDEGFWRKHTDPARFGDGRVSERQWDRPRPLF